MSINKTISRNISSLPKTYQDVAKEKLGADIETVSLSDVQRAMKALEKSGGDASGVVALRDLARELLNPSEQADATETAAAQSTSADPIVNSKAAEIRGKVEAFRKQLDKEVIGQPDFKAALEMLLEARLSRRTANPRPLPLVLGGPSGIGKTSGAQALARLLNDDPNVVPITFDCTEISSSADLNRWKGAAAGFVGYGGGKEPVTPESIAKAGKIPVILVDELSRAGASLDAKAKQALQHEIYNYFAGYVESGEYKLDNQVIDELKGGVIIFTTNAGYEDPALETMTPEQRRDHYVKSAMAEMPIQMVGRMSQSNVIGMDELTASDISSIADAKLNSTFKKLIEATKVGEGFDFSFDGMSDRLKDFLGEAAVTRKYGTRTLVHIIERLIQPKLDVHEFAEDGEYQLDIDPKVTDVELNKMAAQFKAKEGIPVGTSASNFPLVIRNSNARPVFHPYASKMPYSEDGLLNVLTTGMLKGKSYVVIDKGDFSDIEMHFIKPGGLVNGVQVPDSFQQVGLPEELAQSNYQVESVNLDENRALFLSTTLPDDSTEPVLTAYLYDATAKEPWKKVAEPPLALAGAAFGAVDGKAYLFGGREIEHIDDGSKTGAWLPANEIELNNGEPMQPLALSYDADKNKWSFIDTSQLQGFVPRASMGVVTHDDKLFLVGGEVLSQGKPGTAPFTSSSNVVQAFDPKEKRIENFASLKTGVVSPMVLSRGSNIEVLGGKVVELDKSTGNLQVQPQLALQTLDTSKADAKVKVRGDQTMPPSTAQAGDAQAVAAVAGHVVGPFFKAGNFKPDFYRYSVPSEA
jgi:hypothetical protein